MDLRLDGNFRPPGLLRHIERSLRWIGPEALGGLDFIWLMDDVPESTSDEEGQRARAGELILRAAYRPREGASPSYVLLFTRPVLGPLPRPYFLTPAPTIRLTQTLAHEVAHHLIATRGYVFEPGEDPTEEESLAARFAAHTLERMMRRPSYRLARWLLKDLADWHYIFGALDWRAKKYCAASAHLHKAWNLDPRREGVAGAYWRAREACLAEGGRPAEASP